MNRSLGRFLRGARGVFAAYARSYEDGITAAIFAVALLVLLGMVALGIDGGRLYDERRSAQNAADHAAIAAAYASCTAADGTVAGKASAAQNGYNNDGSTNTVTITNTGDDEYRARVDTRIGATFAQVIGFANLETNGEALAKATGCDGGGGFGAIFSGGPCPSGKGLRLAGSDMTITGGVHTNGSSQQSGSNSEYGDVTAPTDPYTYAISADSSFTFASNYFEMNPPQLVASKPWPTGWSPTDANTLYAQYLAFVDDGSIAAAARHKYSGIPENLSGNGVHLSTSTSKWVIKSIPAGGEVVIVSQGQIEIDMDHADFTAFVHPDLPRDGIVILSTKTHSPADKGCDEYSISIAKTEVDWKGILWSPNGLVTISGSGMSNADTARGEGAILSYATKIEGQYVEIRFDEDLFPGEPDVLLVE